MHNFIRNLDRLLENFAGHLFQFSCIEIVIFDILLIKCRWLFGIYKLPNYLLFILIPLPEYTSDIISFPILATIHHTVNKLPSNIIKTPRDMMPSCYIMPS